MAATPVFLPGESQGRGSLVGCRLWGRTESDTTEVTQQQQQQQSQYALILEPKKIKSVTASTFLPSICHEAMGLDAMILIFLILSFNCYLLTIKI